MRVDQYYTTAARDASLSRGAPRGVQGHIPPSTSNLHQRFSRTGQTIELQVMAAVPGAGLTVEARDLQTELQDLADFGLQPGAQRRRFPLRPGADRGSARRDRPIDPEARAARTLWREWPIKLETDFIIKRKLKASLEGAGRQSRRRGESAGLSERPRGRAGLQRGLAVALQDPARHHDHRHHAARLRDQRSADRDQHDLAGDRRARPGARSSAARTRRRSTAGSRRSSPAISCSCPA